MLSQPDELRKALTDARKVLDHCGYSGEIVQEGPSIKIRCFWHQDSGRPNLSIKLRSDGTLGLYCFSCQKGGDVFHLIEGLLGCDFKKAKAEAEKILGGPQAVRAAVASA